MNNKLNINFITESPIIEHAMCGFASIRYGTGKLIVVTNIVTQSVSFKVEHNGISKTANNINEAIELYNQIL